MSSRRVFTSVFSERSTLARLFTTFACAMLALFILGQLEFLSEVVRGNFPVDLFIEIFPSLLIGFFGKSGIEMLVHYFAISLLFGIYVTLLLHIFRTRRYLSFSSMTVSIAALVGVSIGVTCISCGAIVGIMLASLVGAAVSTSLIAIDQQVYLIAGELLLILSIYLVLLALKRVAR